MTTGFPLAIAPSTRTPGVGILVDLKGNAPSPGTGIKRGLLIGPFNNSGATIGAATLVSGVAGEGAVGTLAGNGGPTHLASKRLFEELGAAQIDLVCPAEATGAAIGSVTASGSPTSDRVWETYVAGRKIETVWSVGESVSVAATRHAAAVNARTGDLPVTAASVAGAVNFTAKALGRIGNDIRIRTRLVGGAGGSVTASGATLTGGTTDIDITAVLALVANRRYNYIVICTSNYDLQQTNGSLSKVKTHIDLYDSGIGAKLQQAMSASTDTTNASLKTGIAALNYDRASVGLARDAESLPCEFAGALAGQRLRERSISPNKSMIDLPFRAQLFGPSDLVAGPPTPPEVEDDLQNGISPIHYTEGGSPFLVRPVTTYFKLDTGEPDARVLDTAIPDSLDDIAIDIATFVRTEFRGLNIVPGNPSEIPANAVSIFQVRTGVIGRMRFWIEGGVVDAQQWAAAIADGGEFACRINPSNGDQVDVVFPQKIVKHLAKFSLAFLNRS